MEDGLHLEIQLIIPGYYITHILSHLAGTPQSRMASKASHLCVETCSLVNKSSNSCGHGNF